MAEQIDWFKLRKSLDRVTCIRTEHPSCSYCVTEASAFAYLSKQIHFTKETLSILLEYREVLGSNKSPCDLHNISACYCCSGTEQCDKQIKRAKKQLASLKFRLMSLPSVAKALGRSAGIVPVVPSEQQQIESSRPVERLFGGVRTGNPSTRKRVSDINDNIRLIQAWLAAREA